MPDTKTVTAVVKMELPVEVPVDYSERQIREAARNVPSTGEVQRVDITNWGERL